MQCWHQGIYFTVLFKRLATSYDFLPLRSVNTLMHGLTHFKGDAISVVREGASDEISSSNYNNIFDGEFHKIQIFFDQSDVVFLLDCVQIARLETLPSVNG